MTETEQQALHLPGPLVLVGCGKMGGALLRGWLARGVDPRQISLLLNCLKRTLAWES